MVRVHSTMGVWMVGERMHGLKDGVVPGGGSGGHGCAQWACDELHAVMRPAHAVA